MNAKGRSVSVEAVQAEYVRFMEEWSEEEREDLFSTRSGEGLFSPALTMWLMMTQRFMGKGSLAAAVEELFEGGADEILGKNREKRVRRQKEISQNTGGYSRARSRLSLEQVLKFSEFATNKLVSAEASRGLWRGKRVLIVDGTKITLSGSKELCNRYNRSFNQCGEILNPQILCLCLHDVVTGVALRPKFGPVRGPDVTSEQRLLKEMVEDLKEESLLMGDRNFGVFSAAYSAVEAGQQVLFRLTDPRARSLFSKRLPEGDMDEQVVWRPTKQVFKRNPEIPVDAAIRGRFIKAKIERNGYRPLLLMFFTTSPEPAQELVKLYSRRQEIESDIRALKYPLGMEMLSGKTDNTMQIELHLGVLAYNFIRATISRAAKELAVDPRKISFSRAIRITGIFGRKLQQAATSAEAKLIREHYLQTLMQIKLPNRKKQRLEPRKAVRAYVQRFPAIKGSREEERERLKQQLLSESFKNN